MVAWETEVTDIIPRTHNVASFRFKIEDTFDYKAGQFFFVSIIVEGKEMTKHFSFSTSPTERGYIEFTKRFTDSTYSDALRSLKVGDWARLKGPVGSFTFEGEYAKIAFLSGGIGITPIRSMCKYIVDRGLHTDMVLLYGNRTARDIVFREDFEAMRRDCHRLKVVHVLSMAGDDWPGRRGYIDARVITDEIPDYRQRRFYICGPPPMVETMKNIVSVELALDEEMIITEDFTGY